MLQVVGCVVGRCRERRGGRSEGVKEDWKLHTCIKDIDVEVYEPRRLSSVNTQLVGIHYAAH